jgi:hypothetical protein
MIKRAKSPFVYFSNLNRERVSNEHPGATFGELGKILSDEWHKTSKSKKQYYVQLSLDEKLRLSNV